MRWSATEERRSGVWRSDSKGCNGAMKQEIPIHFVREWFFGDVDKVHLPRVRAWSQAFVRLWGNLSMLYPGGMFTLGLQAQSKGRHIAFVKLYSSTGPLLQPFRSYGARDLARGRELRAFWLLFFEVSSTHGLQRALGTPGKLAPRAVWSLVSGKVIGLGA